LTTAQHYKKSIELAWPVMLGQFGHVLVGLADSIMVGQLGTVPLAAGALGNAIFAIPLVFGIGMAFGMTPPIANADGENKPERAGNILKHALVTNMCTALLVFASIYFVSHFTHTLGQDGEVSAMATPYLMIIGSSIIPLMFFLTFKQFAEGLSDTRFAMVASLGANLINIGLNYLFVFGKFGFPALGLEGAGYATLIARILMAVIMCIYVFKHTKFKLHLKDWINKAWDKSIFKKLLDLGVPSGLQYIFEVSCFAMAAIMVGQMGANALAAHQIAISLASLSYMAASGLGAAATVRVGNQIGKRDIENLKRASYTNFILTLIFMAFCGLVFLIGKDFFPQFYTSDLEVQSIAASLLIIAVFFQLSDGLQVAVLGALRGMSDVKIPTIITLVSYWAIGIGGGWFMGVYLNWGPKGVWYGLALGLTASALLLYWRFQRKLTQLTYEFRK
jgi:MATE family multidrug resistance protein